MTTTHRRKFFVEEISAGVVCFNLIFVCLFINSSKLKQHVYVCLIPVSSDDQLMSWSWLIYLRFGVVFESL